MSLATLLSDYATARKNFMEQAQESMKEAFKEIFELYPEITAFKWVQYTPYFNDGEPCEFSVHDISITNIPMDELDDIYAYGEYEGERDNVYTGSSYTSAPKRDAEFFCVSGIEGSQYSTGAPRRPAIFDSKDTSKLQELIDTLNDSNFEEVMEGTFGDGVCVTVTKNGIEIEQYDHD